jgi:hypothetical protein
LKDRGLIIATAGCVPQLGKVATLLIRTWKTYKTTSGIKVFFQIRKHTTNVEISKFVRLASEGL